MLRGENKEFNGKKKSWGFLITKYSKEADILGEKFFDSMFSPLHCLTSSIKIQLYNNRKNPIIFNHFIYSFD